MLNKTERDGLVIHTSDDPRHLTRAVVEGPQGCFLVETVEETYTETEGAAYNPEDFLNTVLDFYRQGRTRSVQSPQEAFSG
ncbi:hypothetical protein [Deinococcus peraridilitoris]|uniref:Uncharacterized protein n=1 Tax=Deinococcus peraridilitoris (strain DSM 19664 / LMG 22246 / CIP 109416 / KR-200) TaxID=937777 RepID=K9ZXI9_DEIPD|nr:hypothetical protein [Deinococcus peraridilitoris]AFZ66306.1 hypothetical protein Deipe_0727 [Deinococcus peraridilitoris DSM 19664]